MTLIIFLRAVSDAGYYVFFAGTLAAFFGARPALLAVGALLQCLAMTAGSLLEGKRIRFVLFVVPIWYLIVVTDALSERLVLFPLLFYMLNILRSEQYVPTWDREAALFSRLWKIMVFFFYLWGMFNEILYARRDVLEGMAIPAALVTLMALVFLTRALRHDREVYVKGRRQVLDLAILGLLFGIAAVLSSKPVLNGITYLAKLVFYQLIVPVLRFIFWLISPVFELIGYLFFLLFRLDVEGDIPLLGGGGNKSAAEAVSEEIAREPVEPWRLLQLAALALLVFAAYKLLKSLLSHPPAFAEPAEDQIERVTLTMEQGEQKKSERGSAPIERIRREYRRFLKLCRQKGVSIIPSDTSLRVEEKGEELSVPETALDLRKIYIAARYGGVGTKEDADRAELAYRQTKKLWSAGKE